jgi:tetratricopeptide (TPR) repeat protein
MNEGLAEFYQNTEIEEKDVLLGQPSANDILYLREQRLLPLPVLLKVDHTSPYYHEEQKGSVFYAESWALMHYLEVTDHQKNQHKIQDYAKYLIQGEDPVTAAQHAWGDLNLMQKALDGYISGLTFSMFKMNNGIVADESTFKTRTIPATEVNALRAGVLVDVNRKEEERALLETVMRDDPKSSLARETMGYLKFREGDIPSAKQWFGEAVQLDSGSYLAHYYFAVMSMSSGERGNDAAIESSLKTAIKLNASYAPAYDSLAQFYASRQEKLDEAHLLNVQAVQMEPQNMYYRINTATVLAQQQKFASAVSVLEVAAKLAKNPMETANVQSRLEQFRQIQSMMASGGHVTMNSDRAAGTSDTQTVVIVENGSKRTAQVETNASEDTHYPAEPTGPKRKVEGVLRSVKCSYPSVLTATVERPGKSLTLYSNNYYSIIFTLGNYDSNEDINPCKAIEGMKAKVEYSEVTDDKVAGQISAIELNK